MGNVTFKQLKKILSLPMAILVVLWSIPTQALAVELEILGDMTSPHGGFGTYQNLLKYSEGFEDATSGTTWSESNVTVAANDTTLAPDSSQTADKLTFGSVGVDSISQDSGTVSTAAAYTFSIWLRYVSGTVNQIALKIADADENNTTTVTNISSTTWERYSVSKTFATAGGNIVTTIQESAAGDAPVILVWGAQLEKSSKSNVYVRTDDSPVASVSQGLAVGKNVHVTGNLEIHGSITTHGGGGTSPDQTIAGNLTVNGNTTLGDGATKTVTINAGPISLVNAIAAADALEFGSGANLANLYRSTNDTLKTDDAFLVASTLGVTGATTLSSTLGVTGATTLSSSLGVTGATTLDGGLTMDTNKFTVADVTGNTSIGGTLGVTGAATLSSTLATTGNATFDGNVTLGNANLDTVTINAGPITLVNSTAAADALEFGSGANLANLYRSANDTLKTDDAFLVASTLGVTGATTLSSSLGVTGGTTLDGGLTMDTNKFTVADVTGNTSIGGTLGVTGAATLSSTLGVTGNVAVNTDKFTVTAASGNTTIAGTLSAGVTSVTGDLSVRSADKIVMDSADAGGTASDTYMVHDKDNDRIQLYVDGVEVARFKK